MTVLDDILVLIISAAVIFAVRHAARARKRGGCCGCSGCSGCSGRTGNCPSCPSGTRGVSGEHGDKED